MMRDRNIVYEAILRYCVSRDADEKLDACCTAGELLRLVADSYPTACPVCGAEPWVNIDCDLCLVCSAVTKDGLP